MKINPKTTGIFTHKIWWRCNNSSCQNITNFMSKYYGCLRINVNCYGSFQPMSNGMPSSSRCHINAHDSIICWWDLIKLLLLCEAGYFTRVLSVLQHSVGGYNMAWLVVMWAWFREILSLGDIIGFSTSHKMGRWYDADDISRFSVKTLYRKLLL